MADFVAKVFVEVTKHLLIFELLPRLSVRKAKKTPQIQYLLFIHTMVEDKNKNLA